MAHKKGMYFDGHEREDVMRSRSEFLSEMEVLEKEHLPTPDVNNFPSRQPPSLESKHLVTIVHDETAFNRLKWNLYKNNSKQA